MISREMPQRQKAVESLLCYYHRMVMQLLFYRIMEPQIDWIYCPMNIDIVPRKGMTTRPVLKYKAHGIYRFRKVKF